jgi:mannan endo-1,4-beta-mannosidase
MIGEDIYAPKNNYASQHSKFLEAVSYPSTPKIIALSENGVVPDIDLLFRDGSVWSWYATWNGDFVIERDGTYSEEYTEAEILIKMYDDERSITLEDLPEW